MTNPDKLWNATHRDFRATIEGKRYVMRCVAGAATFVAVEDAAK